MSTLAVNSIVPVTAGSENYFLTRAWANINFSGTLAIRADGNISSVTDIGVGIARYNYSTSMTDSNYSVSAMSTRGTEDPTLNAGLAIAAIRGSSVYTTSYTEIGYGAPAWAFTDAVIATFTAVR